MILSKVVGLSRKKEKQHPVTVTLTEKSLKSVFFPFFFYISVMVFECGCIVNSLVSLFIFGKGLPGVHWLMNVPFGEKYHCLSRYELDLSGLGGVL